MCPFQIFCLIKSIKHSLYLWYYQKRHPLLSCFDWETSHFPGNHKNVCNIFSITLTSLQELWKAETVWTWICFLTLILWKLILQLAPALVGINRSPSLLGEHRRDVGLCRLLEIFWKSNKCRSVMFFGFRSNFIWVSKNKSRESTRKLT